MKSILLLLMAALLALPVSAKVHVDRDPEVNFENYRTYAWRAGTDAGRAENQQWIVEAVERELADLGFRKVEAAGADADLFVTTTVMAKIESHLGGSAFNSDYYTMGLLTAQVVPTTRGVLMVDLLDGVTEEPVWRGLADETMSLPDREKLHRRFGDALLHPFAVAAMRLDDESLAALDHEFRCRISRMFLHMIRQPDNLLIQIALFPIKSLGSNADHREFRQLLQQKAEQLGRGRIRVGCCCERGTNC